MRFLLNFSFFILIIISFSSCKKDEILPPTGGFLTPLSGQVFSSDDTLYFTVEYNHSRPVTELSVKLTNAVGTAFLTSSIIHPNKNNGTFSGELFLSNAFLSSGSYTLELFLSDGEISSRTLRQININQIPKVRESVWASYVSGMNQFTVAMLDSTGTNFITNGVHLFTQIDSKNGMLYSCGKNQGDLKAHDIRNNILKWSVLNPGQGVEGYFRAGILDAEFIYVSREDGFVTAYDKNKGVRYNATLNLGLYLENFLLSNSVVVGEKKSIPPGQTLISVFNTNGTGRHETFAGNGLEIVSLQKGLGFDVWVFANMGTGRIGRYDVVGNTLNWLYIMPTGNIITAEKKTDTRFWVSTTNDGMQEYVTSNNSLLPFNTGITASSIKYDAVENELFVWDANTVQVLNPLTGSQIRSTTMPGTALSVNFLYNRN